MSDLSIEKINTYVNENAKSKVSLTSDVLEHYEEVAGLSMTDREALKEFVYNVSLILYKTFMNEQE